jgi:uncharacterized membrane protein YdjX (TVP38/TMEM64 family)
MARESSASKPAATVWPWLGLGAVALLIAFLLSSPTLKTFIEGAIGWAEGIMNAHPVAGAVVFFFFSALSAMLAFASSVVLVPSANLAWGKPVTFLLLWGGWVAGAIAAFGVGKLARPLLARMGYKETIEKYRQFASKRIRFWVVLLFCMAIPSEIPGYLFGGVHYPFFKFVAAIAIAEAIYACGVVVAGESLATAEPVPLLAALGILMVIGILAGLLLRALYRSSRRKRS